MADHGALHDASASYYGADVAGQQNSGHPGDIFGWVIGVGLKANMGADVFDLQAQYTQGATGYFNGSGDIIGQFKLQSQNVGYGFATDGVYANGTSIDLTTAWGIVAAWDHHWNQDFKTSVYGGYVFVSFNDEATANMCAASVANNGLSVASGAVGVCSENWSQWYIGSRTQWDIARGLYVGVDVLYERLDTANRGGITAATFVPFANGPRPTGVYSISDQSAWVLTFRAQRDIVP